MVYKADLPRVFDSENLQDFILKLIDDESEAVFKSISYG